MSEHENSQHIADRRKPDSEMVRQIIDALKENSICIDNETHKEHHEFIKVMLEREHRRLARSDRIREQVVGWAIIAFLGGIGTAVYNWLMNFKDHAK